MIDKLLQVVKASVPTNMPVLVLADRGIGTSPALCQAVEALGWHYLFRVSWQTKIITAQGELTGLHFGLVSDESLPYPNPPHFLYRIRRIRPIGSPVGSRNWGQVAIPTW